MGMFGNTPSFSVTGYGGGQMYPGGTQAPPPSLDIGGMAPAQTAPKPAGGGFFGAGGVGRAIAGSIGDFLLQNAHAQPIYAPAMMEHARDQRAIALAMANHQAEAQQWYNQQAYLRANPNDELTQNIVSAGMDPHSPEAQGLYRTHAEHLGDPMVNLSFGDGRVYAGPASLMPSSLGATPMTAAPKVTDQASYDAIPAGGHYMTPDGHTRIKGGASGNAGGGFRP